jgi:hypothetical protein
VMMMTMPLRRKLLSKENLFFTVRAWKINFYYFTILLATSCVCVS